MTDSQLSLFNDIEWPIFNSLTTHFPNDEYSELEYKSAQGEITRILQELCKQGFLTSENKGRWTTYHLNDKYRYQQAIKDFEGVDKENTSSSVKGNTSKPTKGNSKQRLTKEELQNNILKYCELEFFSVAEIADHVGKDANYLKKTVIPVMIENNQLVRLFPTIINHPQQKYKKQE